MRQERPYIKQIESVQAKADNHGEIIVKVVDELVQPITQSLDAMITDIKNNVIPNRDIVADELNYYIANLPIEMFFVSDKMEDIGIKSDVSTMLRKEKYNKFYELASGTIKDKEADVERRILADTLIEKAHKRAYKKVQNKLDQAENILTSLKKILQWRISELEVTGQNTNTSNLTIKPKPNGRRT